MSGRRLLPRRIAELATLPLALAGTLTPIAAGGVTFRSPVRSASSTTSPRPDVVVILTDDQRLDDTVVMPNVLNQLAAHGTTFTNAIASAPVCCPSRASLLTGRYPHADGTFTNGPDCEGSHPFNDSNTIATTLAARGYRTGLVGKYLNSWIGPAKPPGWSDWTAFSGTYDNTGGAYYDYQLDHNGVLKSYGSTAADYSTDVLSTYADTFIRQTPASQPLFMLFTPFGPHGGQKPAPRDLGKFAQMPIPHGPDFNELDVSDKPAYIRALPLLTAAQTRTLDNERRHVRETLLSDDDAVGTIVRALADTGRLSHTLIVFSSDQGFDWGEHRWQSKATPYDDVLHIPLIVRYDAVGTAPRRDGHLVQNIDIAPTLAALAGTSMPGADGRSFLPLLSGVVPWRLSALTEWVADANGVPSYCAVRTTAFQYARYSTGEEELYDLVHDPYEVQNVARAPAAAAMRAALAAQASRACSLTAWRPPTSIGHAARFVPVTPYRALDTRQAGPLGVEPPYAGETRSVTVAGAGTPVPDGAVAVAVNVTVTNAKGIGYVTAYPAGARVPLASIENFTVGTIASNLAVVPVGATGKVSFYVGGGAADLVLDVSGYFLPAATTTLGRIVSLPPRRILDTRSGIGLPARSLVPQVPAHLTVLGRGGIPASGVAAVLLQITAVDASPGWLTVYPGAGPAPRASSLNFDHQGEVRANLVAVPVRSDGTIALLSSTPTHVLADVAGYVTDAAAAPSASGLFVPLEAARLRDTRVTPPVGPVPPGGAVSVSTSRGGVAPSAAAVFVIITTTNTLRPGYLTAYPSGSPRPPASDLNVERTGQTVASAALVKLGVSSAITVFSSGGGDVIVDAMGYVTG